MNKNYKELIKRLKNMGFADFDNTLVLKDIKIVVEIFNDIHVTIFTNKNYYSYWIKKKEDISFVIKQIRTIKKYQSAEPQGFRPAPAKIEE